MTDVGRVEPRNLVLFRRYGLDELTRRTPYSESYLLTLKLGYHPITEVFRLRVAKALAMPEEELFSAADEEEGADG